MSTTVLIILLLLSFHYSADKLIRLHKFLFYALIAELFFATKELFFAINTPAKVDRQLLALHFYLNSHVYKHLHQN